ncbi:hypothetical protein EI427_25320 [Flammeovirga pectinis]|uniref:Outer membrane protein beta-barrel domain-containing protein n=1 Tax=Flammeovirga pectinis TaxID=2494373 RepID=A0A3S9PBD4_9BACT|nr:hypothetical protein [Flammeovirga pectinis]AZQ65536.1 hypothetical protein EI427_25320 [Flammeovirga pectinis]
MKYILLSLSLLLSLSTYAQEETLKEPTDQTIIANTDSIYPYKFPIWGQKVIDRGYDFPLPGGVALHYVYNEMFLDITDFKLGFNNMGYNPIFNKNTLGFKKTRAVSHGYNVRADLFALPFLDVYGLFSQVGGSTEVSLQPNFGNEKFPEFSSKVEFTAIAFGGGATFNYGIGKYFISWDINYSATRTELLKNNVGVVTSSARFGRRFNFKKQRYLAFYVGAMYRNFTNAEGNAGDITLATAIPGIGDAVRQWYGQLSPVQKKIIDGVNEQIGIDVGSGNIENMSIQYEIKKDLIQKFTFQFGGQFQVSKRVMIRGEYGVSQYSKFLLTGVNYRFGL